jgi:hypothetical protein
MSRSEPPDIKYLLDATDKVHGHVQAAQAPGVPARTREMQLVAGLKEAAVALRLLRKDLEPEGALARALRERYREPTLLARLLGHRQPGEAAEHGEAIAFPLSAELLEAQGYDPDRAKQLVDGVTWMLRSLLGDGQRASKADPLGLEQLCDLVGELEEIVESLITRAADGFNDSKQRATWLNTVLSVLSYIANTFFGAVLGAILSLPEVEQWARQTVPHVLDFADEVRTGIEEVTAGLLALAAVAIDASNALAIAQAPLNARLLLARVLPIGTALERTGGALTPELLRELDRVLAQIESVTSAAHRDGLPRARHKGQTIPRPGMEGLPYADEPDDEAARRRSQGLPEVPSMFNNPYPKGQGTPWPDRDAERDGRSRI